MKRSLKTLLAISLVAFWVHPAKAQINPELHGKVDALIAQAFQSASTGFPCKLKPRGKARMLHWEDVDKCLNDPAAKVDWAALSTQLKQLRDGTRNTSPVEFASVVESSLAARTLPFEKLFAVKDERVLLPLTNSVLKFLPADSLQSLPVIDKVGTVMGSFAGVYSYERSGGSGSGYHLSLFQYADRKGEIRTAPDKLLLDSFGIPWKDAKSQLGFRLSIEKLTLDRK